MNFVISSKVAGRIREIRVLLGITQAEAACRCQLDHKAYQRYESGNPPDMRLSTAGRIASGLGVPVAALFDFD